jgi:hypothetical protein
MQYELNIYMNQLQINLKTSLTSILFKNTFSIFIIILTHNIKINLNSSNKY